MKFMTTLERDEEGIWIAECPSLPGCVSQGKSRDDALSQMREVIALCLEVRAEGGMPLSIEKPWLETDGVPVLSPAGGKVSGPKAEIGASRN